ncbi:NPR2 [[Candida] subhashii]|uniref:NPR2 n=1 Tax=[Candida] subhashii TaxID=561895 RepID=A0A8J5UQW8_9ASCO|nr:NPR2 [[Candida] subhashii]KAG7664337.1 NPR2 [[Candida] subhashii]
MDLPDGFIPIVAVFYAVFHPTEGTKIVHQVPDNSIVTSANLHRTKTNTSRLSMASSTSSDSKDRHNHNRYFNESTGEEVEGLFNFDTVKNYVIPKPHLCNRLISFKINRYKVIGYPVNMENERYSRNSFSFNFCFVFPYDMGDVSPYEPAIKRMGQMFQVLEEQNFILSKLDKDNSFFKKGSTGMAIKDSIVSSGNSINFGIDLEAYTSNVVSVQSSNDAAVNAPGHAKTKQITLSSIESLINQLYQDLNNYSECCIPLDTANSVDIKLFPILPPPINIKAYQVPIATVKLNSLVDVNWDPTMIKILPYIDGLNSVKRISELADANYLLTKQCIQHLMHYKCIEIVDIFQFNNIYAPTNHIGEFLKFNGKMAEDCQAYVVTAESNLEQQSYFPVPSSFNSSPSHTGMSTSPYSIRHFDQSSSSYKKSNSLSKSPRSVGNSPSSGTNVTVPTKTTLFYLYRSLNQGQSVKEWYIQHRKLLNNIDVRRFINFGVLRGIIYRVYSYPLLNSITRSVESGDLEQYDNFVNRYRKSSKASKTVKMEGNEKLLKTKVNESVLKTDKKRKVSFSTVAGNIREEPKKTFTPDEVLLENSSEDEDIDEEEEEAHDIPQPFVGDHMVPLAKRSSRQSSSSATRYKFSGVLSRSDSEVIESSDDECELDSEEREEEEDMLFLIKMLKGYQHFDSISTELQKSRFEVEKMIEKLGSYNIVNS